MPPAVPPEEGLMDVTDAVIGPLPLPVTLATWVSVTVTLCVPAVRKMPRAISCVWPISRWAGRLTRLPMNWRACPRPPATPFR